MAKTTQSQNTHENGRRTKRTSTEKTTNIGRAKKEQPKIEQFNHSEEQTNAEK